METAKLLGSLSNAFGVAGFEDEVRAVIQKLIEPCVDEVRTDVLGNLIATKEGKDDFRLMLDAHTDEIGLIINYIDESGFLRFVTIGGWDARILPAHAVTILTREGKKVKGVIGASPPHILKPEDREKVLKLEDLFIDVGASSREEVEAMSIRIGDPATIHYPFERLNEKYVVGKAFDDRVGCAVIIKVLEELKGEKLPLTLICSFAVSEEIGLRGARTAAYQIKPDLALALECTVAADTAGVQPQRQPTQLGKGPAITIADNTIIVSRRLVKALEELAQKSSIPYQIKLPIFGGTDAGAIHTTRGGILAGVISVPCRYIHSPFQIMRLDDFENAVKLTKEFVLNCRTLLG